MMKKIQFFPLLIALSFLLIPVTAFAQGVPNSCRRSNGQIKCDVPHCRQYCDPHHRGPGPNHDAKPNHGRPLPSPPPAAHNPHPVPAPAHAAHHNDLLRERDRLFAENTRLQYDLAVANHNADHDYEACMSLPHGVRHHCTRPTGEIRRIERKIAQNNREIDRIDRILHR